MKTLVEFELEDGSSIFVEIDEDTTAQGVVRTSRSGEMVVKAKQSFEQAIQQLKPSATSVINAMRKLSDPPDEITVTFGIKMSTEVGIVIASAVVDANYSVSLKWKRRE